MSRQLLNILCSIWRSRLDASRLVSKLGLLSSRFARFAILTLGLSSTSSLPGCNNAAVVKSNIQRSAQARSERAAARRELQPESQSSGPQPEQVSGSAGPQFSEFEEAGEEDGEIEQTSGQAPAGPAVLMGRVVDMSGRPQPGVSVVATASRRAGGNRADATTDVRGNFVLRGLEPGQRYLVLATAIHSSVSLIGRVSATPPEQGVVIEIARPFSVNRQTDPYATQPQFVSRSSTLLPVAAPNRAASRPPQHDSPFTDKANPTTNTPAGTAQRQPTRRTKEELAAENQMTSPWDMPAPPARKTAPTQPFKTDEASSWRPATNSRPVYHGTKLGHSLIDDEAGDSANPTTQPSQDDPIQNESGQATHSSASPDPRQPLSQPLEVAAEPKQDYPHAAVTKANVPPNRPDRQEHARSAITKPNIQLEPSKPEKSATPSQQATPKYDGPMCQFEGNRLVDFQLPDLQDHPVSFSSMNSRLVLVDFWGTWCGYCLKCTPQLVNLQKRFGPQGLQVIGVAYEQGDPKERVARVQEVCEQLGVNYPVLMGNGDGKCPVREKFGIHVYPTLVLLDKSGRPLWKSEGPDQQDLQHLEKLLKTQLGGPSTGYNQK